MCVCAICLLGKPTPQQSAILRKSRSKHSVYNITDTNVIQPLYTVRERVSVCYIARAGYSVTDAARVAAGVMRV